MNFTSPNAVDQVCYTMRAAEWRRSSNRALINALGDGAPPYSDDEVKSGNISVNVNDLKHNKILHDARRQFYNGLIVPDPLFTVNVDYGPVWKKSEWSARITKKISRIIKGSLKFYEMQRSVFAQDVLHGIAPSCWSDKYSLFPDAVGVEDILMPGNTLLDLSNIPFTARLRQYTAQQLNDAITGPHVDPAWNIPVAKAAIKWVDEQAQRLMANSWPDFMSPEKAESRRKEDGGIYSCDAIPTVDCWDFFFWRDDGKKSGWRRRIILDTWSNPGATQEMSKTPNRVSGKYGSDKSEFLYDSGDRVYADKLGKFIHFQFADGSCVAPFKYHSVRSLGWLLYSVCHLQNRLNCKFNESVFESMMQYFRVNNMNDAERALKVDLTDKRPLPDSLQFVRAEERWKVPDGLIQLAMQVNRQTMADNSNSFTQDFDFSQRDNDETATRTMAKVNASAALTASMLNQGYTYEKFRFDEMCRRACIKNSRDGDVRKFRLECLKDNIPEEALEVERWDIQPVRVIGSGNKMLQNAMMDKIMGLYYNKLDPSAQKEVVRLGIAITTDDYDLAQRWVPNQPTTSRSVHDAQIAAGSLLMGLPMEFVEGVNHTEYIQKLLESMTVVVTQITNRGGVATQEEITGLQNIAGQTIEGQPLQNNGIFSHIQLLEQQASDPSLPGNTDETVKEQVKMYGDELGKLMNEVKAFAQRLQEQQGQQAEGEAAGAADETIIKLQGQQKIFDQKADNSKQSTGQKLAQKQISFESDQARQDEKHRQELRMEYERNQLELAAQVAKAETVVDKTESGA